MSTCRVTKEKLLEIKKLVEEMKCIGLNYENYKMFLHLITPRQGNIPLLKDKIKEHGNTRIVFVPESSSIVGTFDKANVWAKNNLDAFDFIYNVKDKKTLELYLNLFTLAHEVEHLKQYLCGKGTLTTGAREVDYAYQSLLDLFIKDQSIIPNPVKNVRKAASFFVYKANENQYVLERNANIEAFDLLGKIAYSCADEEMVGVFDLIRRYFSQIGYLDDTNGSFYETYKKIFMLNKYKKIFRNSDILEIMDDYDKVRFGLPVDKKVREDVLKMVF